MKTQTYMKKLIILIAVVALLSSCSTSNYSKSSYHFTKPNHGHSSNMCSAFTK